MDVCVFGCVLECVVGVLMCVWLDGSMGVCVWVDENMDVCVVGLGGMTVLEIQTVWFQYRQKYRCIYQPHNKRRKLIDRQECGSREPKVTETET